jgi:hypothetical protein
VVFKVEIIEEQSKVYNVARDIKWFGYYMHGEEIDEIDIKTIINNFASRSVRRNL